MKLDPFQRKYFLSISGFASARIACMYGLGVRIAGPLGAVSPCHGVSVRAAAVIDWCDWWSSSGLGFNCFVKDSACNLLVCCLWRYTNCNAT